MQQKRITMQYVPIESVIPYENNPRRNDHAVEAVAASIQRVGWRRPILVDKNMVIIAGHTRLKAAQALGLVEVPVTVADKLPPKLVKKLRLADNKIQEKSKWNPELLNEQLEKYKGLLDMTVFGFAEPKEKKQKDPAGDAGDGADADIIICPRCKRPFSRKEGRHVEV